MKLSRFFFFAAFVLLGFQNGAATAQLGGGTSEPSQAPSNATLQRECDRGVATSCGELGQRLQGDGKASSKEMKKGFALFQRACDGGDATGCGDLAQAYLFGNGVAVDEIRAARFSERACNDGNMVGCSLMGIIHEQGKAGYPKDAGKAAGYFRKACDQSQPRWEFPCKMANKIAVGASQGSASINSTSVGLGRPSSPLAPAPAVATIVTADEASSARVNQPSLPLASPAQAAMLASAISKDSKSWFSNRYDAGSLSGVHIASVDTDATTVRGNYTYNEGSGKGWASIYIKGGLVVCITYWDTYSCNTVRTAAPAQTPSWQSEDQKERDRQAYEQRRKAWEACLSRNDSMLVNAYNICGYHP